MPYVEQSIRSALNHNYTRPQSPGELNYVLTEHIREYLGDSPNYRRFNDVIGALECAKLELYRRMVAPYENKKCSENGDVYT